MTFVATPQIVVSIPKLAAVLRLFGRSLQRLKLGFEVPLARSGEGFHSHIQDIFDIQGGNWDELSEVTTDQRRRKIGWYSQSPRGQAGPTHPVGQWTGGMLDSLTDRSASGAIWELSSRRLRMGSSLARAFFFHEGRIAQPARRVFRENELKEIAGDRFARYLSARIDVFNAAREGQPLRDMIRIT